MPYYIAISETEHSKRHIRDNAKFFTSQSHEGQDMSRYTKCGIRIDATESWWVHEGQEATCERCLAMEKQQ